MLKHGYSHGILRASQGLKKPSLYIPRRYETLRRTYASVAATPSGLSPGDRLHGFTLQQVKHVPELHLTALKLEHDKTGAQYLHVDRDDKNNVFAINFKTNPIDRTGLPHILEHVTLCGSDKYPVRDPFFKMMPRSLSNFMNAFTSPDYTSYPFATTNVQDYHNLASVYLDATLHPLLKHSDFLQEGWRLGPEDPKDVATKDNVIFKGVVYNEMKGQMSDASYLFYIRWREHLVPSLENSGGDPEKMTDLTYEKLVDFSRKHYHPSNARIFSYGNLPLSERLPMVHEHLSKFDKMPSSHESRLPIDIGKEPVSFQVNGPLDTMQSPDRQAKSSLTWLGCDSSDIVESFSVSIMMSLLMSGYGSPLYSLIESGLGTNFSPNSGYDSSTKMGNLTIGLDGMKTEDAASIQEIVQSLLHEKAHEAFLPHKVEGIMHQLEIALKHKTAAFGIGLLEKTLPGWHNGVDPMEALSWNTVVDAFKQRLQQEKYLESLVDKYLLNDNCMHFTMLPSVTYNAELEAREEERRLNLLEQIAAESPSPEGAFSELGRQELNLLHEQESAPYEHIETLPTLHVKDIARKKERKPRYSSQIGRVGCLWRETSTNGITYFHAKHLLKDLPEDLRLLLPLFTDCLMRLGTKEKSVGDLEAEVMLRTGGISISPFTSPDAFSNENYTEGLLVNGYALDENVPAMLDLVTTLILDIDFSSPKAINAIQELLDSKVSGALDSVSESGHHFAVMSASSALSTRGRLQDQLSGLSQLEATTRMVETARTDPSSLQRVVEKLKQIQSLAISNSGNLSMRVVCEPSAVSTNQKLLEGFVSRLPEAVAPGSFGAPNGSEQGSSQSRRALFDLPFQVSYTGTCLQTVPYSSPDKAPLTILGQLLTHNFLHPEVREKGGAYGASGAASPISGLFTMSSYRDPNPRHTLGVFDRAGIFARDKAWSARELEESKLGVFQQLDAPTSVSGEAGKEFMYGITEDMDQKMREQLLDVTKDDVQRVAQQYLVDLPAEQRSTCLLGEKKEWIGQDPLSWQVKHLKTASEPTT